MEHIGRLMVTLIITDKLYFDKIILINAAEVPIKIWKFLIDPIKAEFDPPRVKVSITEST